MLKKPRVLIALVLAALAFLGWALAGVVVGFLFLSPARRTLRMPEALGVSRSEIRSSDGTALGIWTHTFPGARATVVLAHGFRSDPNHWELLIPKLTEARLQTVALEFRAHGQSGGDRISMGARERHDVLAALDHAQSLGLPVLFVGFSMGSAAYLLSGREAHAAVLDSPYDTLPNALRARWSGTHLPFFVALPAYLTLWARLPVAPYTLRPIDHVRALHRPTRLVFAELDHWVPRSSQANYRQVLCPSCTVDFIPGRGHGDHADEPWALRITEFLTASLAPDDPHAPDPAPTTLQPLSPPEVPPGAPSVVAPVVAPNAPSEVPANAPNTPVATVEPPPGRPRQRLGGWCKHHLGRVNPATGERCPE